MMKFTLVSLLSINLNLCLAQESREERIARLMRQREQKVEAQDHLEPEFGHFSSFRLDYLSRINTILLDSLMDFPVGTTIQFGT